MPDSPLESLHQGRYVVTGVLGEGTQGSTLEAVDKAVGRIVAIKRFRVRGASSWKDVELAEREARVLSSLSHPALPTYVDHFEEDGCLHLVMEKIEGRKVSELRQRGGALSHADVRRFLKDAADALGYLHGRAPPVIHRDIKPGNVIRRPDGSFALVDFGAVRDSLRPEGGSTVVGTFGYMAPEQLQGRALPATDVYAVGATALAMLTGREPEDLPHTGLAIDVRAALAGTVDVALVNALSAMLAPDPDQRADDLGKVLAGLRPRTSPAQPSTGRSQAKPEAGRPEAAKAWGNRSGHRSRRRQARGGPPPWGTPHRRRGRPAVLSPPVLVVAALLGLTVAQLATFGLFRLLLPVALTVLSIVFGSRLRRAARACDDLGIRGQKSLRRTARVVREQSGKAGAARHSERTRPRRPRANAEPQPKPRARRIRIAEEEPLEAEHYDEPARDRNRHTDRDEGS